MSNILNGLWTVAFETTMDRYGRGVVVIDNDRVLGGDAGYYYSGTCHITENKLDIDLMIIRYSPNDISVFGNLDHFQLKINGQFDEREFTAIGNIPDIPEISDMGIIIRGTKKEDLA
uniref:T3SS negative regulator,GrlR n=1 Tax=Candidatus Kentrum sp. SD TaxID=2126332 RepID=A0A451BQ05_9GAMM|nr:MAG: T3SS negative regulator,GrlR [Candidatus Kentron sp. SD]